MMDITGKEKVHKHFLEDESGNGKNKIKSKKFKFKN